MGGLRRAGLGFWLLLGACGDDDDAGAPGEELGPCVEDRYCESPLVCTEELVCVSPDQVGGSDGGVGPVPGDADAQPGDGGSPGSGDPDAGSASGGDPSGDPSGGSSEPEIYCSQSDDGDACWCSHTADWGTAGETCSQATAGAPALCCASDAGWPTTGVCNCGSLYCSRDGDSCFCNTVAPDQFEEAVDTCTAAPEGVCCQDDDLGWCLCWDDLSACPGEEYTQLSSCSIASIDCGNGASVAACN